MKYKLYLLLIIVILLKVSNAPANNCWNTEFVEKGHYLGSRNAIVADSSGKVHISYNKYYNGIIYATNSDGVWRIEELDNTVSGDKHTAIAIDPSNNIHISYNSGSIWSDTPADSNLIYAVKHEDHWITETVDGTGTADGSEDLGKYNAIAIDAAGNVHISYVDVLNQTIKYATNASGVWKTEIVNNGVIKKTSIAVDESNKVHLSYYDDSSKTLKYATNASGSWLTESVDSINTKKYDEIYNSIVVDALGYIHIVYKSGEDLQYATKHFGASSWNIEIVDTANGVWYPAMAVDTFGKVHISYYHSDDSKITIKYATNAGGNWQTEIIEHSNALTLDYNTAISIDALNRVHISYFLYNIAIKDEGIKYATNDACETVEPKGILVAEQLRLGAFIDIPDKAPIEARWHLGDDVFTERGDRVIWGYFYAAPEEVSWGSPNNPDVFVKIWFDVSGRIDVNYFHASVPNIAVYTDFTNDGHYDRKTIINDNDFRYLRHTYDKKTGKHNIDSTPADVACIPSYDKCKAFVTNLNTPIFTPITDRFSIAAIINTLEKGGIPAQWSLGGKDTTDRGDRVIWGYFYADPRDVNWGNSSNPELFVKIWFDSSGRIDVNSLYVSVPDIGVYLKHDYPPSLMIPEEGTLTKSLYGIRYVRFELKE